MRRRLTGSRDRFSGEKNREFLRPFDVTRWPFGLHLVSTEGRFGQIRPDAKRGLRYQKRGFEGVIGECNGLMNPML